MSCVSWMYEVQSVVPQEANRQINLSPAIAPSFPLCSSHFLSTCFSLFLSFDLHTPLFCHHASWSEFRVAVLDLPLVKKTKKIPKLNQSVVGKEVVGK